VLAILKVAFMLLFIGIVIIVGSIPYRVKKFKKNRFLRAMGTTFAGALFVNVSLIHILPESSDSIEAYLKEQTGA
jgi:zinc transporter 1/2/3